MVLLQMTRFVFKHKKHAATLLFFVLALSQMRWFAANVVLNKTSLPNTLPLDNNNTNSYALAEAICSDVGCTLGNEIKQRVRHHITTRQPKCFNNNDSTVIRISFEHILTSEWLGTGNFLQQEATKYCADTCQITTDTATADIVFFMQYQPKIIRPNQQRAVINLEAHTFDPHHLAETDIFVTYHKEADVVISYGNELYPHLISPQCQLMCALEEIGNMPSKPATQGIMMSIFVSASCNRHNNFIPRIMALIPSHSFGACFNNQQEANSLIRSLSKAQHANKYPFYLAIENTILEDYVTEKFYMGFRLNNTVMVYLGAPNAQLYAPAPNSFIHANTFASVETLVAYLHQVAADKKLFQSFLAWRPYPSASFRSLIEDRSWPLHDSNQSIACRACAVAHKNICPINILRIQH